MALSLPPKIAYCIADISGSLYYLLAKKDKRIATDNIKVVLQHTGDTHKLRRTSRAVFVNFARYLVEFFSTPRINLEYVRKHVKIEGRENLDRALSLGKGLIMVSAHLGNWELAGMIMAMMGYKVNAVAWKHKNKLINDFFLYQRQSKGLTVIPLGTGIRRVFSALKNNEIVGLLGDIDYANPQMGVKVRFFGRDTIMPKGPAAFSLKAGCPVLHTFLVRENGQQFRLILEEPIIYKSLGNWEDDLTELTKRIVEVMESYIARYPGQWFMLTPRWPENKD